MVKCERIYPPPPSLAKKRSYNESDTIQMLKEIFHDKCYICEMQGLQDGIPEHLIPHKENKNLKFAWENLFWACNRCNSIKNNVKYEEKIIDCCKVDPEKHLLCTYEPHDGKISVKSRDTLEDSRMTAMLIDESFNLDNTGLRQSSYSERMKLFRAEWNKFLKYLDEYRKKGTRFAFNKVKSRLNRSTAFAAIKRDYIRIHHSEWKDFQKFVDEKN